MFIDWDVTNEKSGLREIKKNCIWKVLAAEIPLIRGNITAAQESSDQARNRATETKGMVLNYLDTIAKIISGKRVIEGGKWTQMKKLE